MKSILYISYTGMTDPLGQSQVLAYVLGLSQSGKYRFTILSLENEKRFEGGREQIFRLCKEHNIRWIPLMYVNRPRVLATIKGTRLVKNKIQALHKLEHFDLVHCRSYRGSLIGLWMKRLYGVKMIFDMRGFWADERIEGNIWDVKKPVFRLVYRYFKQKEKELLHKADRTVSLTENARREINTWDVKGGLSPVSVIPCCVDLDLFDPRKVEHDNQAVIREQYGISESSYVVSYLGSLGTWYLLDEMLIFFRCWLDQKPDSIFLFITNEPAEMIYAAAQQAGVRKENLRITALPRQQVPQILSLSHCSLFFYKPSFSRKACSPVKQGEIMALGIPVICSAGVGDTAEIVEKYNAGIVVKNFDEATYTQVIVDFLSRKFDKEEIRKGAESVYSLEKGIQLYDKVYQSVL